MSAQPPTKQLVILKGDAVTPKLIRWLWPGKIPLGKITLFCGIPGEGKSLATIDVAARVTKNADFCDAKNPLDELGEVLFIASEDDAEDALKPRLLAAGADCSKVHIVRAVMSTGQDGEASFRLDADISAVRSYLQAHPPIRLIIIDPLISHLGRASALVDQDIRAILNPFAVLAAEFQVAVLCVIHLNKKEGLNVINRVSGALSFIALARASWLFGQDAEHNRFMAPIKNNYTREQTSLSYGIEQVLQTIEGKAVGIPIITWGEESGMEAVELLVQPRREGSKLEQAKTFLQTVLDGDGVSRSVVLSSATTLGISKPTLYRAKERLGVSSSKLGDEVIWILKGPGGEN